MSFAVFPTFQDIFPGTREPTLDSILQATPSSTLLKIAAFLNSRVHLTQVDTKEQEKMFIQWISAYDIGARRNITENYLKFKQQNERRGSQIALFTSVSLLRLMDRIMLSYNDLELQEESTAKVEMACFRAWLVNNTELAMEIQNSATPRPNNLSETLLITQASQYEYVERKDIFSQILFSRSFFDYLSGNIDFKPYLTEFLACKNLKSSSQYLRALTEVYMMGAGEGFSFRLTPENQFLKSLFDSFTLPIPNEDLRSKRRLKVSDPDFKAFRVSPLVRLDENNYYILHHNFFVDKLYKGLLFDFFKETSIHKRFKDFPAFLQILGSEFAEKNIFYEYVSGCFGKNSYVIKVPGDKYANIEYTDFYIREGKSIFLFEFKNALVSTAVKQSMDYQTIEQEIFKKLVRNERGKPKGVTQLLKVIKDLVSKPFPFDDFVAKRVGRLHIYPLLVCTDDFFTVDGVEKILSTEFDRQLAELGAVRHKINPVVLVHIDDLIAMQLTTSSGNKKIKDIIDLYHQRKSKRQKRAPRNLYDLLRRHQSFRSVVGNELINGPGHLIDRLVEALRLEE